MKPLTRLPSACCKRNKSNYSKNALRPARQRFLTGRYWLGSSALAKERLKRAGQPAQVVYSLSCSFNGGLQPRKALAECQGQFGVPSGQAA